MAGDAEATSRPTPVARARVAVAGLAALSVALLPALAVPTWLDSQDIEPLPASVRSAPREDVQGVNEPARSSYSARASLCGMPDNEDYEELGRLLASAPSWTPTEAASCSPSCGASPRWLLTAIPRTSAVASPFSLWWATSKQLFSGGRRNVAAQVVGIRRARHPHLDMTAVQHTVIASSVNAQLAPDPSVQPSR